MGFPVSMMCWDQGCVGSVMDMGWMFDFLGWRAGLLGDGVFMIPMARCRKIPVIGRGFCFHDSTFVWSTIVVYVSQ